MLKIEIDAQDVVIKSRTFKGRDGKPDRISYSQDAYMYNAGRFPTRVELPLDEGVPAYPAGFYTFHHTSYSVGKFGKMEGHPYAVILVPWDEAISQLINDKDRKHKAG